VSGEYRMAKGLSTDSQIHISVALLVKAVLLVAFVTGAWYQAQMKFAEIDRTLNDLHEEVVVLSSQMQSIQQEHIQDLESQKETLEQENKSLMQKLGLKR